jgi:hypothetical protein
MEQTTQPKLTIVIHETGNAMSIQQEGMITRLRAARPSGPWTQSGPSVALSTLSLACCEVTYSVLKETILLRADRANGENLRSE